MNAVLTSDDLDQRLAVSIALEKAGKEHPLYRVPTTSEEASRNLRAWKALRDGHRAAWAQFDSILRGAS
jgi:hypothetical protein